MTDILRKLSELGVSIWLDDISRERLRTGNLADLIKEKHVVGVTSNPTIFAKALSKGSAYDDQLRDLAVRGVGVEEASRALTTYDIRWACDVLRPIHELATDQLEGVPVQHGDGRVSIEVDPRIARQTEATVAEARALWWMVDRPNLFIKIPATVEGLPAIAQTLSQGISVNVTLIFSLERYGQVIDAFFEGLEKAKANGHDLSTIASVASFFVSRVDTEVDKRLDKVLSERASGTTGSEEAKALRGKAGIANARLAYALYEEKFGTDRWKALKAAGAHVQRPLWASTGVKDPAYPDTMYVVELVAPETVNTMPEATLDATADHAKLRGNTIQSYYDEARTQLAALAGLGIAIDDVVRLLEEEGVEKFETSWNELLETIKNELRKSEGR